MMRAKGLLEKAERRLNDARKAFDDGFYSDCIRHSQECTELSLKASLRFMMIEYPKKHDVSDVLLKEKDLFPDWFKTEIGKLIEAF